MYAAGVCRYPSRCNPTVRNAAAGKHDFDPTEVISAQALRLVVRSSCTEMYAEGRKRLWKGTRDGLVAVEAGGEGVVWCCSLTKGLSSLKLMPGERRRQERRALQALSVVAGEQGRRGTVAEDRQLKSCPGRFSSELARELQFRNPRD